MAQQAADAVKDTVQHIADQVQDMGIAASSSSTAGGPAPNSLLDEETGEHVSKSELKKRQKQREKQRQKAEREATREPPPQPKRKAGPVEEDLTPNVSTLTFPCRYRLAASQSTPEDRHCRSFSMSRMVPRSRHGGLWSSESLSHLSGVVSGRSYDLDFQKPRKRTAEV